MLHELCVTKQNQFYSLEDKYRVIFSEGVNLLFEQHPELRDELPNEETKAAQILAISDSLKDEESGCKRIAKMMKTIPQLVEAENMNAEIGEACLEYFFALCALHSRINEDRKRFFSEEYLAKMDELGFGNCTNTRACEAECPKAVSISNIARLNREFICAKLKD